MSGIESISKTYNKDCWNNKIEGVRWYVEWKEKDCSCGKVGSKRINYFDAMGQAYDFISERQKAKDYAYYTGPGKEEIVEGDKFKDKNFSRKSNYEALTSIINYWESGVDIEWGFIVKEQIDLIKSTFQFELRSNVELQDLRDFVVIFLSKREDNYISQSKPDMYHKIADCKSAVTHVIDVEKSERGCII